MADIWMDVDTAVTVPVNRQALIDDGDFKTREESVTYNQAGLDLLWNFVTPAGVMTQTAVTPTDTGGVYDWTNVGNGMYKIEIPASGGGTINNATEGFGWFTGFATGILPWVGPICGFRAAGLNGLLIEDAFSVTRGLAGTALPAAAADAAGGLPISDAGGLDIDAKLANTNEVTAARMGALTDWINGGRLDLLLDAIKASTDVLTLAAIADAVWDEVLTGATHNVATSAGRRLRELGATSILSGTASAGAANSITLAGGSATNEIYDSNLVAIVGGTGAGQTRAIVEYNGTSKVAIVDRVWETNPDSTSEFQVIAFALAEIAHHGLAQAGAATTITLASTASTTDDIYIGSQVFISTSSGTGQTRLITDYVGATRVATVSPAWVTNPTSASVYKIIPVGRSIVELLGVQAKADVQAEVVLGAADIKADTAAILLDTGTDGVVVDAASKTGLRLGVTGVADIRTTAITEAYAADGAAPTPDQALMQILQFLTERSISATTLTVKKLDGSTSAMTFTLNDSVDPTSITRAT